MLLGTYAQECEVIGGVKVPHHTARLVCESTDEASVLDGGGVVQCALNGDAWKHTHISQLISSLVLQ